MSGFADRLRGLADLYDATPGLIGPTGVVRVYTHRSDYGAEGLAAYRDAFSTAVGVALSPPVVEDYYVKVALAEGFELVFTKHDVGEKRTVTREVEEFVLTTR